MNMADNIVRLVIYLLGLYAGLWLLRLIRGAFRVIVGAIKGKR